jgi:hypothetical protein
MPEASGSVKCKSSNGSATPIEARQDEHSGFLTTGKGIKTVRTCPSITQVQPAKLVGGKVGLYELTVPKS